MKVSIEAPWTKGEQQFEGMLGFIQQGLMQLKHFQKTNKSQHLLNDIEGYEEIIKSNSELNARSFMELKGLARRSGNKVYQNNLEVIKALKNLGRWE